MKIEKLKGTEKRLYSLIAPLVMNKNVIQQNDNYPFVTSDKHNWYVASSNKKIVGFLSLKGNEIKNDYTNQNLVILKYLVENVIADNKGKINSIRFLASNSEIQLMQSIGFTVESNMVKYSQMKYEYKEEL